MLSRNKLMFISWSCHVQRGYLGLTSRGFITFCSMFYAMGLVNGTAISSVIKRSTEQYYVTKDLTLSGVQCYSDPFRIKKYLSIFA